MARQIMVKAQNESLRAYLRGKRSFKASRSRSSTPTTTSIRCFCPICAKSSVCRIAAAATCGSTSFDIEKCGKFR